MAQQMFTIDVEFSSWPEEMPQAHEVNGQPTHLFSWEQVVAHMAHLHAKYGPQDHPSGIGDIHRITIREE